MWPQELALKLASNLSMPHAILVILFSIKCFFFTILPMRHMSYIIHLSTCAVSVATVYQAGTKRPIVYVPTRYDCGQTMVTSPSQRHMPGLCQNSDTTHLLSKDLSKMFYDIATIHQNTLYPSFCGIAWFQWMQSHESICLSSLHRNVNEITVSNLAFLSTHLIMSRHTLVGGLMCYKHYLYISDHH